MRNVELVEFPKEQYKDVTQMSQYIRVSFAFVNEKYEEIMQRVKCKDFMNVPNWQRKTGIISRVYGWIYNFKKDPYDVNVTRISFDFEEPNQRDNFIKNIIHLNEIENKYNITPTEILLTQNPNVIIVEGDKVWQSNCWKMSMYMMYLRRMGHENFNAPVTNSYDASYKQQFDNKKETEHNMMSYIHSDIAETVERKYNISTAHSGSGAMTILYNRNLVDKHGNILEKYAGLLSEDQLIITRLVTIPNPDFVMKEAA